MATVFRIHNQGAVNSGWFESQPLTSQDINTIVSKGDEAATSIPSPFAQMALVKTAFDYMSQPNVNLHYNQNTQQDKAMHQLVSDALDVAQLFFDFQTFSQYFQIVEWNPANGFQRLMGDGNPNHKTFSETLDVFWKSDANIFNFNRVGSLYFILTKTNKLIGATSPMTMFMAAPDVRDNLIGLPQLVCGNDVLFDNLYFSLDQRDPAFIEYMYTLQTQTNFAQVFPSLNNYLLKIKNGTLLPGQLATQIAQIQPNTINNYAPSLVQGVAGNQCVASGIPLGERIFNPAIVQGNSDFVISPNYQINGILPLVLPDKQFNGNWKYSIPGSVWNPNWVIDQNSSRSVLPNSGLRYPWLSISDFLEDKIIKLPYDIDSANFITGMNGNSSFLLPLKSKYFEFFSANSVTQNVSMQTLAGGGVQVSLSIPVKNNSIKFSKLYQLSDIVDLNVHLAILPFMKTSQVNLDYTVALHDDRYGKQNAITINSMTGALIQSLTPTDRLCGNQKDVKSVFFRSQSFDGLQISDQNGASGFVIPLMPVQNGNNTLSFAVDFGTTNTHIEYKLGNNAECALDIPSSSALWRSMMVKGSGDGRAEAVDRLFDSELFPRQVPYAVNANNIHAFPFRTSVIYNQSANFNNRLNSFLDVNPFLLFEKISENSQYQVQPNLKWSNYSQTKDQVLVEKYIESLLYIALYKALMLGADPASVKVTWFYPISMATNEKNVFTNAWVSAFGKVFNTAPNTNLMDMPESVAPYLYYRSSHPGRSLSIDIGGGSSDIALFDNAANTPKFISSFRFAGNSIYGDGFSGTQYQRDLTTNGYYKTFADDVKQSIEGDDNLKAILVAIENTRSSSNFSSFLFSLENNGAVNYNYIGKLQSNRDLKMSFLLFFGAVVYYSAKLIKLSGDCQKPDNILFSGTAARSLRVLDGGSNLQSVGKFFNHIMNCVLETTDGTINVVLDNHPKQVTCKGAFRCDANVQYDAASRYFWIGGIKDAFGKALNQREAASLPTYSNLTETVCSELISSFMDFYRIMDSFQQNNSIDDLFGINDSAYEVFREVRNEHLIDYVKQGINSHHRLPGDKIEETLFFMPFVVMLNDLANKLTD